VIAQAFRQVVSARAATDGGGFTVDPVTISVLAGAALKVVGPYLSKFAGKVADGLVGDAADSAVKGAKKLFESIKKKFAGNRDAEASVAKLEAAPEDPAAHAEVEKHLAAAMATDPDFAAELESELTQIANTKADLAFVNNVQGDVGKLVQINTVQGNVSF
jgi:hypothetical protein